MTMSTEQLENIVRETIMSTTGIDIEITPDLSLIDGGILDSMSIVTIVQSLQAELDIDFDFADITIENFDSLEVMVPFLQRMIDEKCSASA